MAYIPHAYYNRRGVMRVARTALEATALLAKGFKVGEPLDLNAGQPATSVGKAAVDTTDLAFDPATQVELNAALAAKADLVGGKVPVGQLPSATSVSQDDLDDVAADLGAHEVGTLGVHGITDTTELLRKRYRRSPAGGGFAAFLGIPGAYLHNPQVAARVAGVDYYTIFQPLVDVHLTEAHMSIRTGIASPVNARHAIFEADDAGLAVGAPLGQVEVNATASYTGWKSGAIDVTLLGGKRYLQASCYDTTWSGPHCFPGSMDLLGVPIGVPSGATDSILTLWLTKARTYGPFVSGDTWDTVALGNSGTRHAWLYRYTEV